MKKRNQLNINYCEKFQNILKHQFIIGLEEKRKVNLV